MEIKNSLTDKSVIEIIKMFLPNDYSFCLLEDSNFPNINWTIPSTEYNESYQDFLNFCTDNFLTQVVESPTYKNLNILDLLICNPFGLNRSYLLQQTCVTLILFPLN